MLWELLMALQYLLARKTSAPPPPYVDPDWDAYLRNKYGIAQSIADDEEEGPPKDRTWYAAG